MAVHATRADWEGAVVGGLGWSDVRFATARMTLMALGVDCWFLLLKLHKLLGEETRWMKLKLQRKCGVQTKHVKSGRGWLRTGHLCRARAHVCVCVCVCFLPGAAGLAPYSEALFLLPLCFHVVLVCSSLAVRTQPLGGCTMFLIEEWGWIFAHLEKSQLGPSPHQQQPKGRDKWPPQPHTWQTSSLEHCVIGNMTLRHGGQSSGSCPNFAIDYYYCISQILRHHWL